MYTGLPFLPPSVRLSFLFTREKRQLVSCRIVNIVLCLLSKGEPVLYRPDRGARAPIRHLRPFCGLSFYICAPGMALVSFPPVRVVSVTCPALRSGVVYGSSDPPRVRGTCCAVIRPPALRVLPVVTFAPFPGLMKGVKR